MKKQYVKDLKDGDPVNDYFRIKSKEPPRKYRDKDGLYFSMVLEDRTGSIQCRFWGGPDAGLVNGITASLGAGDAVGVAGGRVSTYQGKRQLQVSEGHGTLSKAEQCDEDELATGVEREIPNMRKRLDAVVGEVGDPHVRGLLESLFGDEEFAAAYARAPASKGYHHGYPGGLLEHSLSMAATAKAVAAQHAPHLDEDLLVAGCLLHDIGKMDSYDPRAPTGNTAGGILLGHIPMGAATVLAAIGRIEGFPEALKLKMLHMVLSHHGSLEKGSPVEPAFPEAVALHKIDDCDAQVKHSVHAKEEAGATAAEGADAVYVSRFGYVYLG